MRHVLACLGLVLLVAQTAHAQAAAPMPVDIPTYDRNLGRVTLHGTDAGGNGHEFHFCGLSADMNRAVVAMGAVPGALIADSPTRGAGKELWFPVVVDQGNVAASSPRLDRANFYLIAPTIEVEVVGGSYAYQFPVTSTPAARRAVQALAATDAVRSATRYESVQVQGVSWTAIVLPLGTPCP